ncbi:protein croquemort [Teleopsis dalmanni]|uniref:protein croquemort n=1 Tax=Teleopsis dalmanni TaxID=139649 RepID=UPI0018CCB394|nr:protein croquemort [Teleopsis dalmanni]
MCCNCCSVRQQKIWVFTLGTLFLVIGIVLIAAWPHISNTIINSMLPLSPGSYTFNKWEVTPIPLYMNFYLYNWTNPDQAYNPDVRPHFEEVGPYYFRDTKIKQDLKWHDENNTVTFFGLRNWYFDAEKSNGSLDDMITTPHFPTMAASKFSLSFNKIIRKVVNFGLNREGGALTMTHSAIDWLFHGFYEHLLDFVERLHSPLLPIYVNKFAWFYGRNNSKEAEGSFTIHTGKDDLSQLGDLKLWNGSAHTGFWKGDCGKINGSTGDIWAPGKSWDDTISIFISDVSRFINLFPQEVINYRGVEGWVYTSTDQTFDSGYVAPDTKCFCTEGRKCPKNGVIDFSPVAKRAPVFVSHPHFYMTDPLYLENTTGLSPIAEKHGIKIIMEPKLGAPLYVNGQVLISLFIERNDDIDFLRNLAYDFYAPLFVVQIQADITDDILKTVKFALSISSTGQYIGIGFTTLGVLMLATGIWVTKTHKWRNDSPDVETVKTPAPET